jgi:hypothetical protein
MYICIWIAKKSIVINNEMHITNICQFFSIIPVQKSSIMVILCSTCSKFVFTKVSFILFSTKTRNVCLIILFSTPPKIHYLCLVLLRYLCFSNLLLSILTIFPASPIFCTSWLSKAFVHIYMHQLYKIVNLFFSFLVLPFLTNYIKLWISTR